MRSFLVLALLAHTLASTLDLVFELDGNAIDNPQPGLPEDWSAIWNHGVLQTSFQATSTFSVNDLNGVTVFTGGQTKDIHDFPSWSYQDVGSVPPKADFNTVFGASYNYLPTGEILAVFGGDMLDRGTGTVTIGVWFLQSQITASGGRFIGNHVNGDVLLVIDFTGSRSTDAVNIQAYKWQAGASNNLQAFIPSSTANFKCQTGTGDIATVCATYNVNAITDGSLPFANDVGTFNAAPATFWEGGVNFNRLFGGAQHVPCFSSIIAETRASNSLNSVLEDFAQSAFRICGAQSQAACGAVVESPAGSGQFTATFSVTVQNTGVGTLSVSGITVQNLPGSSVVAVSPVPPTTISAGTTQTFTLVFTHLPGASFSPQVQVNFNAGPAPLIATATCPLLRLTAEKVCSVSSQSGTLSGSIPALYLQVSWTLTVHNTGDVPVQSCSVSDGHGTTITYPAPITFVEGGTSIAAGSQKTITHTYIPAALGVSGTLTFSDTATVTCVASTNSALSTSASATTTCSLCP